MGLKVQKLTLSFRNNSETFSLFLLSNETLKGDLQLTINWRNMKKFFIISNIYYVYLLNLQ